jgi:predicted dehydrogenase
MTERDPLRLGIVGAGAISQVVHLPIFAERADVDLVALGDRDVHKAEALSQRFSIPLVMESDELLDMDELDAVVICTPNHLHEEMAIRALQQGKHVIVERPLAATSEGASRVIEAAVRAGTVLAVGMPHRFRPEVLALRSFVEGGELGELHAVRGSWLTRSFPSARQAWRVSRDTAGGGALVDLGIPALDLCLSIIGFPETRRLTCLMSCDDDGEVEHSATMMLETADGTVLSLEVSNRLYAGEDRYFVRVMGADGSGRLPPLEVYKLLGGRPMDVTPRQPRPRGGENAYTNAYRRLLDDFVRRVTGVGDVTVPVEQVGLMRIIEAAYRSAESGREVDL